MEPVELFMENADPYMVGGVITVFGGADEMALTGLVTEVDYGTFHLGLDDNGDDLVFEGFRVVCDTEPNA